MSFVGASAGGAALAYTGSQLKITQSGSTAILNWQSFNINAGNSVQFIQPSTSAIALNRIFDPNVTSISGTLTANGQVYLINPNGILFGSKSVVNVGGLIASTLDLNNQRVTKGFLYDPVVSNPVFSDNPSQLGNDPATSPTASPGATPSIVVLPGASLYAAGRDQSGTVVSAGRIFLFAPQVENGGSIKVDGGGQVILASGSDIYLGSSSDPSLRGLLVEVTPASANDSVSVDATGSITVAHGNITLMGLAVNQAGSVVATSALDDNGSIRLISRTANPLSQQTINDPDTLLPSTSTGTVTLASGSKTEVILDPTDTATAPLNDTTAASLRSTITIEGASVNIGGSGAPGSTIVQAHGGDITVTARTASNNFEPGSAVYPYALGDGSLLGAQNSAAVINVGADALIDTSGLQDVMVDGARNFVYIDRLTSNNLANAPYQRTGFLLGQGVYVNLADTPSWIDVANLQAAVAGTQAERNTVAGKISLLAEGSVNLAKGSVLNVSGGSVDVSAAVGRTSELVTASGAVVNISNASPDVQYVAFADHGSITTTDPIEGINQTSSYQTPNYSSVGGYTQGSNAGTVEIYAPSAVLGGTLLGSTTVGPSQRSSPPLGGLLRVNSDSVGALDQQAGFSRPDILLAGSAAGLAQALTEAGNPNAILLDTSALLQAGFDRLNLTSDGLVSLAPNSPLNLGPGGQFVVEANQTSIGSSLVAPGGTVSLSERPVGSVPGTGDPASERDALNLITNPALRGLVSFTPGTRIDVNGLWTNDTIGAGLAATQPIVLNGGQISISDRTVDVSGASFDVSAGAALSGSGAFTGGAGGSLSIIATNRNPDGFPIGTDPALIDLGVLELGNNFASRISGYGVTASGVARGGSLTIGAPTLYLGGIAPATGTVAGAPAPVQLTDALAQTGFASFTLSAYETVDVPSASRFAPQINSFFDSPALNMAASSSGLLAVAAAQAPTLGSTVPSATITLTTKSPLDGSVIIGPGALVDAGSGGAISLTGAVSIDVAGTLRAQGGTVALELGAPNLQYLDSLEALNARSIQLENTSVIDASGISLVTVNAQGLRTGNVLAGGTVSIDANLGSESIDPGAKIHAGGTVDQVDELSAGGTYQLQTVASAGGVVEMSATTGLTVLGSVDAPGGGANAEGGRLSVSLLAPNVQYTNTSYGVVTTDAVAAVFALPTDLLIAAPGATLNPSTAVANVAPGYVSTTLVNGSGFDQVWLQSADRIRFIEPTSLTTRVSLVLAAQSLDLPAGSTPSTVALRAPFVALGQAGLLSTSGTASSVSNGFSNNAQETATAGNGVLSVTAQQIDLVGSLALVDVQQATLHASGAVVAVGTSNVSQPSPRTSGALSFAGDLKIDAAGLLPSTQTDFSFLAVSDPLFPQGGNVSISDANTGPLGPQYSAGGTLSFAVNNFQSSGRVIAPQGQISISASGAVVLQAGSLLSSSASTLVPFGSVVNGTVWVYDAGSQASDLTPWTIGSSTGVNLQARGINITAPTIDSQSGSTISVAGGGDLLGVGFVPGPGGSYDYATNFPFSSTTQRNPYFAIVPSIGTAIAPYDAQIYADLLINPALPAGSASSFQVGQTISIASGSAIPAGTYTVLPPGYAVLPGAYAVLPASGYTGLNPGSSVPMPDGTVIVAGKLGFASAGTGASLWSGFRVYTNAQFNTLTQFQNELGSQYLTAAAAAAGQPAPRLGPDAGALLLDATSDVRLSGAIETAPLADGRGASIDIVAPSIVVAESAPVSLTEPAAPAPMLTIDAAELSGFGAESVVLGAVGTRQENGATLSLSAPGSTVAVQDGAKLSAGEVILVGTDVSVGAGATVSSSSAQPQTTALVFNGDGSALYVGNVAQLPASSRVGGSAPGTAVLGTLEIASGALIKGASVVFSASAGQSFGADFGLSASNVALSAEQFNLGDVPSGATGLSLSPSLLAILSSAGNLTLASTYGFDAYGNAQLGTLNASGAPTLSHLTLIGPGISGFGGTGSQVGLTAGAITLDNSAGNTTNTAGTGTANLTLTATANASAIANGSIDIAGPITVSGFSSVALNATGIVEAATAATAASTVAGTGDVIFTGASGSASSLTLQGTQTPLSISATRVTATRGVQAGITVPGLLSIASSGPASTPEQTELGASLQIQAGQVDIAGRIDLPAGVVQIGTTGTLASNGIVLESGSLIRVAGVTQSFASTTADVSAGTLSLTSANGSVVQQAGSVLDLSGAGTQGDAGSLEISAPLGAVTLGGSLTTVAPSIASGAYVSIDAATVDLNALSSTISQGSGGANSAVMSGIDIRSRTGNLALAAGNTLRAGSITLEADGGNGATDGSIAVVGTLDASGAAGGQIALYANDQVLVQAGALLNASASGTGAAGGTVMISSRVTANATAPTTLDAIIVDPNSTINVAGGPGLSGGATGTGGTITFRANALAPGAASGADVEVAPLPVAVLLASGARQVVVEGVVVNSYAGDLSINSALLATDSAMLATYMSSGNIAGMTSRLLGGTTLSTFSLRPGLEIDATGAISVASAWDFATGLSLDPTTQTISCATTCTWRYGGTTLAGSQPGALTLRSAGDLAVNANMSDGFLPTATGGVSLNPVVWQSQGGESWSYVLTAGADLSAANPNRVGTVAADLTVGTQAHAAGVAVRTGTGSIALNASEDVALQNGVGQQGNVVYTAGIADIQNLPAFPTYSGQAVNSNGVRTVETVSPILTENGGSLTINAGRDILGTGADGANQDGSTQTVNEWLFRGGTGGGTLAGVSTPSASVWWVQFEQFQQGFGALGGGNLSLAAGRDIVRVGAVVPSVGIDSGAGVTQFNSGALNVRAGGNVVQGLYYDQAGTFSVNASAFIDNPASAFDSVRFAQGDNRADIQARLDSYVSLSFNPTAVDAAALNVAQTAPANYKTDFFTYGSDGEFDVRVAAGSLTVSQVVGGAKTLINDPFQMGLGTGNWEVAAPNVELVAFGDSISGNTQIVMYPSSSGQLRVLADGAIESMYINMSQADAGLLGNPGAPVINDVNLASSRLQVPLEGATPLHATDNQNAEFVARSGSIENDLLTLPKAAEIAAGDEIGPDAVFSIQNSNAASLSVISAGKQLDLSGTAFLEFSHIFVGGLGAAEVLSGGPMNLGTLGEGIESRGNLDNANLPAAGASLLVAAGVGRDSAGLAAQPDFANVIQNFVRYDAFASEGAGSGALNAQVIAMLATDPQLGTAAVGLAQVLTASLADRATANDPNSSLNLVIATLTPAQLLEAGVKLASNVQVVNNATFVAAQNQDTFAPAYAAFGDLFPNLNGNIAAIDQFVQDNPFASAPNSGVLRNEVLDGLPAALANAIRIGLATPSSVSDPNSSYAKALAAIDSATLASGARMLLANVLSVAGTSLDALKANGQVTGSGTPYAKELTTLAAAFTPRTTAGLNDIQMDYNEIKVDETGSLSVFAPQGSVIVGQAAIQVVGSGQEAKSAAQLGIFTLGGGDIIGMVRDDFNVFQSRVFTVAGGDIDLWSSLGNIDAGRGARDVTVASPPEVVTDPVTGLQYLNFGASVTGSGIGALVTEADQPPSNINLMAPAGYVDAGEAGIRAQSGKVTLGTNLVLNAGNIQAASGVSGGAVVAAPPPPAPPAALSNAGEKALEETQNAVLGQQAAEQRLLNQQLMHVVGEFISFKDSDDCDDPATADSDCANKSKDKK